MKWSGGSYGGQGVVGVMFPGIEFAEELVIAILQFCDVAVELLEAVLQLFVLLDFVLEQDALWWVMRGARESATNRSLA